MATKLHKRTFVDTGCLTNTTTTDKENIIALSMHHTLGKFDPSDKYVQTYRNRNIIKLYKNITEEKLTKTNTLVRIYLYIHAINIRMIDKNKNNIINNLKHIIKLTYLKQVTTFIDTFNETDDTLQTTQLHLTTLNVNRLYNDSKRNETFELLMNRKIAIAFLQEIPSTPQAARKWEKEWKGKSLWHSGPISKASGVATLFRENLNP